MRLPDSVQVGPHKIDIFQTPEISEYFGKFHYAKNLIELTTDREEAAIHVLGAQLFQLLRQNPKLVKFIIQEK